MIVYRGHINGIILLYCPSEWFMDIVKILWPYTCQHIMINPYPL